MKNTLFLKQSACCLAAVVTLGACTSQPTALSSRNPSAVATGRAGQIPTRDGKNNQYQSGGPVGGADGPEYAVRTGSHIPQKQNRRGYTTDSPDSSFVYDQNDIRLQSTNNVEDSLRTVPGLNVHGSR